MFVIEIFLPLLDNSGRHFPKDRFDEVRDTLTAKFGGVTAFVRAPAVGLWEDRSGSVRRDEIVVFEVMHDHLDRAWWQAYRRELEIKFAQQELVLRVSTAERI